MDQDQDQDVATWRPTPTSDQRRYIPPARSAGGVRLRPIFAEDYPVLQRHEQGEFLGHRWRHRGATQSPEQWARGLWEGVLTQFLVQAGPTELIGVVRAYGPNFHAGYTYLGVARFTDGNVSPRMMLGLGLFIEYLFEVWPFRKLYMEVPEYNFAQIAGGASKLFNVEGRLVGHTYYRDAYWDELILAITRSAWASMRERIFSGRRGLTSDSR